MSETHTPTPWHIESEPFSVWDQSGHLITRVNAPMSMDEPDVPWERGCANATFIVTACNSHDTLREQVAKLRGACSDLLDGFWDMSPLEYAYSRGMNSMSDAEGERIKERARAALAETKEPASGSER